MRDVSRAALACILWVGGALLLGCAHGDAAARHDDPWAEQLGDAEVEATVEGTAVLWTLEPGTTAPPDDPHDRFVAVSPRFPAGTLVRVTRRDDGRSVTVQVRRQEQLPFGEIALSAEAGRSLGVQDRTQVPALIEVLVAPSAQLD